MNVKLALGKWSFAGKRETFYADLAEALDDNGVLVTILEDNQRRLDRRDDVEASLFALWLRRLDECSFPEALRGTVPAMDVMILAASEAAGNLIQGLGFLAQAIAAVAKMKRAITRKLAMPVLLGIMEVAFILMFALLIEPQSAEILPVEQMPVVSQILHLVAAFIRDDGVVAGIGLVGFAALVAWSLPRWTGKLRLKADRYIPIYSIYRDYTGAVFLVAMASLMKSGVGLAESMYELRRNAPNWLKWHIDEILHRLDSNADEPAKAFSTGVFSQALTDRVEDFGKRSYFEVAIGKVGLQSVDKIVDQVTISAEVMNVVMMISIALTLVFILGGTGMVVLSAAGAVRL